MSGGITLIFCIIGQGRIFPKKILCRVFTEFFSALQMQLCIYIYTNPSLKREGTQGIQVIISLRIITTQAIVKARTIMFEML